MRKHVLGWERPAVARRTTAILAVSRAGRPCYTVLLLIAILCLATSVFGAGITTPPAPQIVVAGNASGSGNVATQKILFADGFESGDCSAWTAKPWLCDDSDRVDVNTNNPRTGSYSLNIAYPIAPGSPNQDLNRWIGTSIADSSHVFVRGYFYLHDPADTFEGQGATRKFYWVGDDNSAGGGATWDVVASFREDSDGAPGNPALEVTSQGGGCFGTQDSNTFGDIVSYDAWHHFEMEVQKNTPAASGPYDGIVRVWIDGALAGEDTAFKVNGNCSTPLRFVSVGRQYNRFNNEDVTNAQRDWDDIVVATGYIGP